MKIYIGTDHRGVDVQNNLYNYLKELGLEVYVSSLKHDDNDDYPDFAFDVCQNEIENDKS